VRAFSFVTSSADGGLINIATKKGPQRANSRIDASESKETRALFLVASVRFRTRLARSWQAGAAGAKYIHRCVSLALVT